MNTEIRIPQTETQMVALLTASIAMAKRQLAAQRKALRVAKQCARLVDRHFSTSRRAARGGR